MAEYIDPDYLYGIATWYDDKEFPIYTFLYEPKLGLVYDQGSVNHHDLLHKLDREYDIRIGNYPEEPADPDDLAMFFHVDKLRIKFVKDFPTFAKMALIGRTASLGHPHLNTDVSRQHALGLHVDPYVSQALQLGNGDWLVTFWNDDREVYEQLLPACMLALYDHELLYDPVVISTPVWGTKPYTAAETTNIRKDPTPTIGQAELEKMRQMHLMRGDEKKKAMDELGLSTASQKHPMQAAMEKGNYITPGQKWWAPHSESAFRKNLDRVLNEILRND